MIATFVKWTFIICFVYRHTHVLVDRGVSWEMALQLYDQYLIDHQPQASSCSQLDHVRGSGFYRSKKEQYHCHLYVLALLKENSTHLFNITRFAYNSHVHSHVC